MSEHDDELWDEQQLQALIGQASEKLKILNDVQLPESLKSENLLSLLEGVEQDSVEEDVQTGTVSFEELSKKGARRKWIRQFTSVAAAFVCIVGVLYAYNSGRLADSASGGAMPQANGMSSSAAASSAADNSANDPDNDMAAPSPPAVANGMPMLTAPEGESHRQENAPAADYSEIRRVIGESMERRSASYDQLPVAADTMPEAEQEAEMEQEAPLLKEEAKNESAQDRAPVAISYAMTAGSAQTASQAAGTEEGDIVKADSGYLYSLRNNADGPEVSIVDAANLEVVSTIPLENEDDVSEIYLMEDSLILIGDGRWGETASDQTAMTQPVSAATGGMFAEFNQPLSQDDSAKSPGSLPQGTEPEQADRVASLQEAPAATAIVYNIEDCAQPRESGRFRQSGSYLDSRLCDGTLYLISEQMVTADVRSDEALMGELVPCVSNSTTDSPQLLGADDIVIGEESDTPVYSVVSAIQVEESTASTKALLGTFSKVYVTPETFYLFGENDSDGQIKTDVFSFSDEQGELELTDWTVLTGSVSDPAHWNASDGCLRVITTSYDSQGTVRYTLSLLERGVTGSLEDLTQGKWLNGVSYQGDILYLSVDSEGEELLTVDLSDPGHLKVQGRASFADWPTVLQPLEGESFVGLGENLVQQEDGLSSQGMKLSLYDLPDPGAPKESFAFPIGEVGSYSEALSDSRAFLCLQEKKIVGFPVITYGDSQPAPADGNVTRQYQMNFNGYLVFSVDLEDGISLLAALPGSADSQLENWEVSSQGYAITRGMVIGDRFYTVSNSRIAAYSMDDYKLVDELLYL